MKLAVSHPYFNKKLEEFGKNHDESVQEILKVEKKILQKKIPAQQPKAVNPEDQVDKHSEMSEASKLILAKRLSLITETLPDSDLECDFSIHAMKRCFRKCFQLLL